MALPPFSLLLGKEKHLYTRACVLLAKTADVANRFAMIDSDTEFFDEQKSKTKHGAENRAKLTNADTSKF